MQEVRVCKECGQQFVATNGMQWYCKREHFRDCAICGQKFLVKPGTLGSREQRTTCSKKCAAELRRRTNVTKYGGSAPASSKEIQEKIHATMLERYGVSHAMKSPEFLAKMRQTNKEKYGSEYYGQTAEGRAKIKESWEQNREYRSECVKKGVRNKYGVDCIFELPEFQEQARKTLLENTGYEYAMQNPETKAKAVQTNLKNFGVEYPLQSKEVHERMRKMWLEKYGTENPMELEEIQSKIANTNLERYGVSSIFKSPEYRNKIRESIRKKYGAAYFAQSAAWKRTKIQDPSKAEQFIEFDADPKKYISEHYDERPTLQKVCEDLGVGTEAVSTRLDRDDCREIVNYYYSKMEEAVYAAIFPYCKVERNTHAIITPYELDLYLPEYKIGIECNPTSTHNSSVNVFSTSEDPTPYNYHKMKTDLCEERGVFLFHIFGYDWTHHKDVIVSMLKNLIGKNERRIYARKCIIREVSSTDASVFLDLNHRQGSAGASVRLGLYYDDELVSLMTFGKMRKTIGTSINEDLSDCWELVRFCNVIDTSVVGGASKLFKHFIENYRPTRIRSFSDRAHTRGTLYPTLGFTKVRQSDPGYVWVDSVTDRAYNRYNAQKQHIKQFLNDDSIDLSKSETEIMISHGFLQVFDSGTITWEWKS